MINYVAHWDRILIQSRSQIIDELNNHEFRSICPIGDGDELKKHYAESINWHITREKYFDFSAIISLRKIIKNLDNGSVFHIFTLKTGFLFMISNLFLNKNFFIINLTYIIKILFGLVLKQQKKKIFYLLNGFEILKINSIQFGD